MPTNQQVINAVYTAAAALGISGWALLKKAGLTYLVRERQAPYAGPSVEEIPGLTEEEKAHITAALPPIPTPPPPAGPPRPLEGKGLFIWRISKCEDGDAEAMAAKAQAGGLTHVLIKIAHGPNPYRYNITTANDKVAPLVTALRTLNFDFQVWGWQYTLGEDPEGDAQMAVTLVQQYRLDGFVINAEKEYKRAGGTSRATRYTDALRQGFEEAGLADLPIALSSYRFPRFHRGFPWGPFLNTCTLMMPQVYWVARVTPDPVSNLQRCLEQYHAIGWTGSIVPTGAAYDEWQRAADGTKWLWSTTADQVRQFLPAVRDAGLPAVNFWSWEHTGPERWQAIAEFQW